MQRLSIVVATCAAIIGTGALASGSSADSAPKYVAYAACGLGKQEPPAHKCTLGSRVGAFLKSSTDVQFKLCVRFPNDRRICAEAQNVAAGKVKVNKVTSSILGRHKLVWYLPDDRKIVRYFRLVDD
jgi:hypothetical protein